MAEVRGERVTVRRRGLWLLAAGLALVVAVLGYRVWRVWRAARPLLARMDTVQALREDPGAVDPATLGPLLQDSHADLVAVRDESRPFLALAARLGWVPGIGPDLQAIPPLLDVAVDLAGAGEAVLEGLDPLLALMDAGATGGRAADTDTLALAVATLADAQPQLEVARTLVSSAAQRRAHVDGSRLSPRLARLVELLDRGLPLAQAGLEIAPLVPDLLGHSGPRTFLVLAQNSDELRPSGGFISGVGRLTVDGGSIVDFSFADAYTVDDFTKPYDEPPLPLYDYMLSELWLFRDANWSPDFPTSAQKAAELYTYGQGVELDGVIAFDQQGAARLVQALGPIRVDGWDGAVTGDSFVEMMREAWNPTGGVVTGEWARTRKGFLNQMAQAGLEQVRRQPATVDWVDLGLALWQVLEERHLMVYLEDPAAASWLHMHGWDGSLRHAGGDHLDYLMAVDANLGFNKVNPRVERALDYRVALGEDGGARAELTVTYRQLGGRDGVPCRQQAIHRSGEQLTYDDLMEGCYWDYLRVYVPQGSRLWAASRHPTPGSYLLRGTGATGEAEVLSDEGDRAVFAQFFVVEQGHTLETRFRYDLPRVVRTSEAQRRYTLLIQKQPGTEGDRVSVSVVLPPGARLLATNPAPKEVGQDTVTFELRLQTDAIIEVVYDNGE